jgi:hypothetical protein
MKMYASLWKHLTGFFLEHEIFQKKSTEEININVAAIQITDDNTLQRTWDAIWMQGN